MDFGAQISAVHIDNATGNLGAYIDRVSFGKHLWVGAQHEWDPEGASMTLHSWMFQNIFNSWLPTIDASLTYALTWIIMCYLIMLLMYPKTSSGKHDHNSDMEIGISVTSYFSDTSFMMGSL